MSELQNRLFQQRQDTTLFELASSESLRYLQQFESLPVTPTSNQLERLTQLDTLLPQQGVDGKTVIKELAELGLHTTVKQMGGRYFGFVNGSVLPVGIAARWLADTWDQNGALYVMSPLNSQLEQLCQTWLVDLLKLPSSTVAGLVGGTSVATLCALAAARHHQLTKLGWDLQQEGLMGAPPLRIVLSRQTHGTVIKMLHLLGFGEKQLEWIDTDHQGRLNPDKLPQLGPDCILVMQAGNVCSGAFDNFAKVIPLANQAKCWVHVDGAFGLWAAASAQFSVLTQGVQLADSWSVDGHKTLNTPYDCGIVLCRHERALTAALHQQGSYIQSSMQRDSMNFTPDMSRRARGIDLWACLRSLGKQGISDLVELLHQRTVYFAQQLRLHRFTVLNDVVFNQILIALEHDEATDQWLKIVQDSGKIWCGGAMWFSTRVMRISVCSWATTQKDIDMAVAELVSARQQVTM